MATDQEYDFCRRFEGYEPCFYLDTNGYVTVGVGCMVSNVKAAIKLNMRDRASHAKASPDEIADDYRAVSKLTPGMKASHYRNACNLEMTDAEIRRLFDMRVAETKMQLRAVYSNYDAAPATVRLALVDLAFNLGCGALNRKWPKLKDAVLSFNWTEAAKQSYRPGSSTARNLAVAELFHAAYTA